MKLRRSMLFIPGNNPAMARDVMLYAPDSVMFDLEDAIAITEKDSARTLTHFSLKNHDYHQAGIETVVRINTLESGFGVLDLEAVLPARPDVIRLPKTESKQDILAVEQEISRIELKHGIVEGSTKMIAAIESALGVINAYEVATASPRLVGIALGGEDYVTNLKTKRYPDGLELLYARSTILNAGRAAGIDVLDTVYSDVQNEEGFVREAKLIHQLGFNGKSLIHPSQILLLHDIYCPNDSEIQKAKKIMEAAKKAQAEGQGVITVDGKMVDAPIIARAAYLLTLAQASKGRVV